MIKRYKKVFFCSAFNDISYILFELDNCSGYNSIIFVTNNEGIYEFFHSLNILNLDIKFIKSKFGNVLNPFNWVKEFYFVHFSLSKCFREITGANVFLSATFYDTLSMFAAGKLMAHNSLVYGLMPELGEFVETSPRLYDKLLSLLYRVPIGTYISGGQRVSGITNDFTSKFISNGKSYNKFDLIKIQSKYLFHNNIDESYILVLCSKEDDGLANLYGNVSDLYLYCYNNIKKFKYIFKGHPRLGGPKFLNDIQNYGFPKNIPVEFVDLSKCKMVIGSNSVALSNLADRGILSVSVINLMQYYSHKLKETHMKYLNDNTNINKIIFPNNIEELRSIILNL